MLAFTSPQRLGGLSYSRRILSSTIASASWSQLLSEPTVKNHVTAILKALKVANRTEAVIASGDLGWVLP